MQNLHRIIARLSIFSLGSGTCTSRLLNEKTKSALRNCPVVPSKNGVEAYSYGGTRIFSVTSGGDGEKKSKDEWEKTIAETFGSTTSDDLGWDSVSSWSTGLAKEHFDGEVAGHRATETDTSQSPMISNLQEINDKLKELGAENRKSEALRFREESVLMKQVREPGARGSYLKDSEKAEMYRLHKENPEVYTVERLAKDYRIMRQRVHAILWLKEDEEEMEKKLGHPLDDSVEVLLDSFPEFFNSHDREFHVASLPYKPDFKVMPEGWDGTTRDLDEVHYEISKKEDEMLYEEFVQKMNFNKMKVAGKVFCHKYSRRRPSQGWKITVEKMGPRGKRGGGGGWRFVSMPDGSSRPLDEMEKMYLKRETPRRRRKILPPF